MTKYFPMRPDKWRNFSTKFPLPAFYLNRGDLKRLYQIVNAKQQEYRCRALDGLIKAPQESDADFAARQRRVHDAFVTSVTVTGRNGEMVHGNNEAFLEDATIPERIASIYMTTVSVPLATLNFTPPCNIVLFLDFTQPPLLDFARLPTLPTPNESNFAINADDENWFASAHTKLKDFFFERKTKSDWLHRAAVYDVLLMFLGIPAALWTDYRAGSLLDKVRLAPMISTAVFVYVFLIVILVYRSMFSYSRWVFPKVEFETDLRSSPLRHRLLWGGIFLSIVGSALYDIIKVLFL
jgi:hypothetical protein